MSQYQSKSDRHEVVSPHGQCLTSFQRQLLQKRLPEELSQVYRQRIAIMLLADEGKSQTEICQTLGCCAATVRHWMHIARSGMAHQWQDCPKGRPKAISDAYREKLRELISRSPREYGYSFRRWTVNWLCKHLADELGIEVSDRHLKRVLKQMGLSTIPKPSPSKDTNTEKTAGQKILISDLKSENSRNFTGFFLLESEK
jgi:transposase